MRLLSTGLIGIVLTLVVSFGMAPAARAESPMSIVVETGAWKVLLGGPLEIYVITMTDQVTIAITPIENGLQLSANVPEQGLDAIAVQLDGATTYTLAAQNAAGAGVYGVLVGASESRQFIHALTAGKAGKIVAGGNSYPFSLSGTSSAIEGLSFYGKEHGLHLPPPFTPATPLIAGVAILLPTAPRESVNVKPTIATTPPLGSSPMALTTPSTGRNIAVGEDALISIVEAARRQYDNGSNDMAKGAARPRRASAICAVFRELPVTNWTGTITNLSSNGDGKGVLSVDIGSNITLKTSNNSFSDSNYRTLIEPDSPVFIAASGMKMGQKVFFSGTFFHSETDCLEERSLTLSGSIEKPEFIFRFSLISILQ